MLVQSAVLVGALRRYSKSACEIASVRSCGTGCGAGRRQAVAPCDPQHTRQHCLLGRAVGSGERQIAVPLANRPAQVPLDRHASLSGDEVSPRFESTTSLRNSIPRIEIVPAGADDSAGAIPAVPVTIAAPGPRVASPSTAGWLFVAWLGGAVSLLAIVVRRAVQRQSVDAAGLCRVSGIAGSVGRDLRFAASGATTHSTQSLRRSRLPCDLRRLAADDSIPRRLLDQLDEEQFRLVSSKLSHWACWDLQFNLLYTCAANRVLL